MNMARICINNYNGNTMIKILKIMTSIFIVTNLVACSSNNLPDSVMQVISDEFSSRGQSYPIEPGEKGVFYFNTKVIESIEIDVVNKYKDRYVKAYCMNINFDFLHYNRHFDRETYRPNKTVSFFAYVAESGKVTLTKGFEDWNRHNCTLKFSPSTNE